MVTAKYSCEVCGREFDTIEEAEKCQNQKPKMPNLHIGDLVKVKDYDKSGTYPYNTSPGTVHYWVIGFQVVKHEVVPLGVTTSNDSIKISGLYNISPDYVVHRDYVDKGERESVLLMLEKYIPKLRLKRLREVHEYEPKSGILSYLSPKLDTDDHPLDFKE